MEVGVIADDLTGAADSGVQLARSGYRTAVVLRGAAVSTSEGLDAVAVDTGSRSLPAGFSAKRVVEAAHAVRTARVVYKKIDSTLRGPIPAETVEAVRAALSGNRCAVLSPRQAKTWIPRSGRARSRRRRSPNAWRAHSHG